MLPKKIKINFYQIVKRKNKKTTGKEIGKEN
jgi:hypothetical protein